MSESSARFTVLAVDDMPENLALINDILGEHYRIIAARDGRRALQLAASDPRPDLILLDLMMPGMDGYAVCRELKADQATADIPVIFVTARSETRDELRGFVVGAVDFISKPVSPPLLRARVQNHLELAVLNRRLQQRVTARTRELELQVREKDAAMARAEYLALHDPATGLPNGRHARARLAQMLEHSGEDGQFVGVLHFNIDRLGLINHSAGPQQADLLIIETAQRLKSAAGREDFVARLDSDNFMMLLNLRPGGGPQAARDKLARIADGLRRALAKPVGEMSSTSSVGTALLPADATDADAGIACARVALRAAKRGGPNSRSAYHPELGWEADEEHRLEQQLVDALDSGRLQIHFQPQVHLESGLISGAEALIRWPDGSGGYISNGSFLPVAEHAGLSRALDEEVMQQALAWLTAEQQRLPPGFRLGINVSTPGLARPGWLERIPQRLAEAGIEPGRVELEITEQGLIQNLAETSERLRALCAAGLHIAADDFGSGYSSLAWLESLPIDRLKLDRQFILRLHDNPRAATIASAMIRLAADLDIDCVVEGIEDGVQHDFARSHGAPHGQGFYLHHPMPAAEFNALLAAEVARQPPGLAESAPGPEESAPGG